MAGEADAMKELNALRDAIAQKKELKVLDDGVMLGTVKYARKTKTPIRTKKGFAELDTLVLIALHAGATQAQYISAGAQAKVTTLDFFEKPLIAEYLSGKPPNKVVIDTAGLIAERISTPAAAADVVDADRPSKKQRTEQGEVVSLTTAGAFSFEDAARLEVAAHTRTSILQAQTPTVAAAGPPAAAAAAAAAAAPRTLQSVLAVFDASRKGVVDGAAAITGAPAHSSSSKSSRSDSKHSHSHSHSKPSGGSSASSAHAHAGKKRPHGGEQKMKAEDLIPIILVPDAVSSLITMLNAKEFFSHSNFTPSASTTAKAGVAPAAAAASSSSSSSSAAGGGAGAATAGKPDVVVIERPSLRDATKTVRYHVMDSTSKLNAVKGWKRVVAVFAHGAKWQFAGYPWDTPAQIFDNIAGYHLHFDDEPLQANIKDWKITKLKISKTKRYQDRSTLMEFWQSLGDFISAHPTKKTLLY